MTVSLTPALSQWARVKGSALRATFIVTSSDVVAPAPWPVGVSDPSDPKAEGYQLEGFGRFNVDVGGSSVGSDARLSTLVFDTTVGSVNNLRRGTGLASGSRASGQEVPKRSFGTRAEGNGATVRSRQGVQFVVSDCGSKWCRRDGLSLVAAKAAPTGPPALGL
jgi:hypothetical protein